MKNLIFYSLSSGSSGNCYYIGNGTDGILVDAGISTKNIRKSLDDQDIPITSVKGILITHNHTDHVRGLEVLARRHSLPVYTSSTIWKNLAHPCSKLSKDLFKEIQLREKFQIAGFHIECFPVSHDAPETVGFQICSDEKIITIATDTGQISDLMAPYLEAANLLVIESNYDEEMLINGQYPYFLKKRIMSDKGHLCNTQTSDFLADNINDNHHYICLAHLSKHNNTPELALQCLSDALSEKGIKIGDSIMVSVLKRNKPSEVIKL